MHNSFYLWQIEYLTEERMKEFFYIIMIFVVISCEFEDMGPMVETPRLNGDTTNIVIEATDTLIFTATFQDDVSLNNYFLSITPAFDTISSEFRRSIIPFVLQDSFSLSGRLVREFNQIIIPASAMPGAYTFDVTFADEEDQLGNSINLNFTIINSSPLIILEAPLSDSILLSTVETLMITGSAEATDSPLDSIALTIQRPLNDSVTQSLLALIFSTTTENLDPQFQIFSTEFVANVSDTGIFDFQVFVVDRFDNSATLESKLIINE